MEKANSDYILILIFMLLLREIDGQMTSCGGSVTQNEIFSSPGYPSNYYNNLRCTWNIEKPGDYHVILQFTYFQTESGYDYVYVYDYVNGSPSLMNSIYDGSRSPFSLSSTGNKMRVTFSSDGSITARGFSVTVSFAHNIGIITIPSDKNQTITSPGYPSNYINQISKEWILLNSDTAGILTLTLNDMNIGSGDYLEIRDGNSSNSQLIGQFTGMTKPKPIFTSSRYVWFLFRTDSSYVSTGFNLNVRAGCYIDFFANQGVIASPGYPNRTDNNNLNCQWRIQTTLQNTTNITFFLHDLQTEHEKDIISVRNTLGNELATISGNTSESVLFTSSSNDITLYFNGDSQNSSIGFNITFSKDCHSLQVAGGTFVGSRNYLSTVQLNCNSDYYLASSDNMTQCMYGGSWSQPIPVCNRWYLPSIQSSHQVAIEGFYYWITCVRNASSQSLLEFVNSDNIVIKKQIYPSYDRIYFIFNNLQANDTDIYRCKETIDGRVKYSETISVNVTWLETPELYINKDYVMVNESVEMFCNSSGFPTPTYKWYKGYELLQNGTDPNYTINNAIFNDTGSYYCIALNDYLNKASPTMTLDVWYLEAPNVNSSIIGDYIDDGENVTLSCQQTGNAINVTYVWLDQHDRILSGKSTLDLVGIKRNQTGNYTCRTNRGSVERYSRTISIDVTWVNEAFLFTQNNRSEFVSHSNIHLRCLSDGNPSPNYLWYKDNIKIIESQDPNLLINNSSVENSGSYQCTVQNLYGTSNSSLLKIFVWELGIPAVSSSVPAHLPIGTSVVLNCSMTGNAVNFNYTWLDSSEKMVSNTSTLFFNDIQVNQSGIYKCVTSKENVTSTSSEVEVFVAWIDKTEISVKPNASIPNGSTVTMQCKTDGYPEPKYTWYKDYVWINGTNCSTFVLPAATFDDNGHYHCVSSNGYDTTISDQQVLEVWNLTKPTTSIVGLTEFGVAQGGSDVTMNCSTSDQGATLNWVDATGKHIIQGSILQLQNITKENTGVYRCKSQKENIEVFSLDVIVNVAYINGPHLNILPSNLLDKHTNAVLECNVYSFPTIPTFSWFFQNVVINGETLKRIVINDITENNIGLYTCSVNFESYTYTSSVSMLVNYLKTPILTVSPSLAINEDDAVVLKCDTTGSGNITFQWFRDDSNIPGLSMFHTINSIQRNVVGNYQCVATNNFGTSSSNRIYLEVNYLGIPYIIKKNTSKQLELNCSSNGNPQPTYQWTHFGEVVGNESLLVLDNINDTYIATYICHVKNVVGEYTAKTNANEQYLNLPKLKMVPSENVYEGGSMLMLCETDGSKPIQYQWFMNGIRLLGQTSMYTLSNVRRQHSGAYRCQATNGQGSKLSIAVSASVYYVDTPSINTTQSLNEILIGDDVIVTCASDGNPAPLLRWYKDSKVVSNSSILYLNKVDRSDTGSYVCKVFSGQMIKEASIQVTVNYLDSPKLQILPSLTVDENTPLLLTCHAESNLPVTYTLFKDDVQLNNKKQHSIAHVRRGQAGNYTCVAVNKLQQKSSNKSNVVVDYFGTPVISSTHVMNAILLGDDVIISCASYGNYAPLLRWHKDSTIVSNSSKLYLDKIIASDTGSYVCKASSGEIIKEASIEVIVNYLNLPQLQILPGLIVHENTTLLLTCHAESNLPVTYTLFKNGVQLTNDKQYSISHVHREQSGNYTCVAANKLQQTSSNKSNVVVEYFGTPIINSTQALNNILLGVDVIVSCASYGKPVPLLKWYKGSKIISNSSILYFNKINISDTGSYACNAFSGRMIKEASIEITVNYLLSPQLQILPSLTVHENTTLLLTCHAESNLPVTYTLFKNGVQLINEKQYSIAHVHREQAGNYTCVAANKLQQTSSNKSNVVVEYFGTPTINSTQALNNILLGDDVIVSCASYGKPVPLLQWYKGSNVVRNSSILYLNKVNVGDTGSYVCKAISGKIVKEAFIEITVNYLLSPQLQILPSLTVHENTTLLLTCHAESNLPVTYTLFKNDVQLTNGKQYSIAHVRREQSGNYKCVAVNKLQQKSSNKSNIVVEYHDKPRIKTSSVRNLREGDEINLMCEPVAIPIPHVRWYKDGEMILNVVTLTLTDVTRNDSGEYTCETKNGNGIMTTSINLMVDYIDKPIIEGLNNSKPVIGHEFHLSCKAKTSLDSTYLWYKDENVLSFNDTKNMTGNILTINDVTEADSGVYRCTTMNILGSKTSELFSLLASDYCAEEVSCDENAYCINGVDSYQCICEEGFTGNGQSCQPLFHVSQVRAEKVEKEKEVYRWTTLTLGGVVGVFVLVVSCYIIMRKYKRKFPLVEATDYKLDSDYSRANPIYEPSPSLSPSLETDGETEM